MFRIALAAAALSIAVAPAVAQPTPPAPPAAQPTPPAPAAAQPEAAPAAAPEAAAKGKDLYDLQCRFCHDDDTMGPTMTGVHERKIAAGGFEYSDSLKAKSDQTWTDANLEAFLKAPNEFAPGTKMQMAVTDDANRAAIIAYLKTLK